MEQPFQIETLLKFIEECRVDKRFVESAVPYTPEKLIKKITKRIKIRKFDSIGVLFTVEWALHLKMLGYNTITVIVTKDCNLTKQCCNHWGFQYIIYNKDTKMPNFDVIVGNPPYQDKKGNEDSTNSTDLAAMFVRKSFESSTRIVALVIPSDWTGPNPSTLKNFLFKENQLKSLTLDGGKWFDVAKDTCTFIYDRTYSGLCEVTDINNKKELIDLSQVKLLSLDNTQTNFIHKFDTSNNLSKRWLRGSLHLSGVVETPVGTEFICAVGQKDKPLSVKIITPGTESTGLGLHKVVVPNVGEEGWIGNIKIGTTTQAGGHSVVFLTTGSTAESDNLKAYLESKVIRLLIKSVKKSTPNSKAVFTQIPDIPLTKKYSDQDLYTYFNFTQAEIDYIESNSK